MTPNESERAADDLPHTHKAGDPAFCPKCKCVHPLEACPAPTPGGAMYITLPEFLTEEELAYAQRLFNTAEAGTFAAQCVEKIIAPQIERINRALGQKNDATYLAYAVEYAFNKMATAAQEKGDDDTN